MNTIFDMLLSTAFLVWIGVVLERTNRRTQHLGRAPFGADLEGDRDITRTLAEIDARRG